ncbi:hypothetical protein KY311_04755 [Candidatus Woesearchaeota archaeon]|nr:hypothetical protein [Candidatus Woesearchaeota archaeon]MBW3017091.1 hypothetical protein [Candidatus Woesearchaeota archaeon]
MNEAYRERTPQLGEKDVFFDTVRNGYVQMIDNEPDSGYYGFMDLQGQKYFQYDADKVSFLSTGEPRIVKGTLGSIEDQVISPGSVYYKGIIMPSKVMAKLMKYAPKHMEKKW